MAFDSLPGMKITISQLHQNYIIGDYFAVFGSGSDIPEVYEWSSVKSYIEAADSFTITLFNGNTYKITKNCFTDSAQLISFRSIVEGQLSGCANTTKKVYRRIIPPKYNYRSTGISGNVFSATGIKSPGLMNFPSGYKYRKPGKDLFAICMAYLAVCPCCNRFRFVIFPYNI